MSAPFNKEQELDDVYTNLAHEIRRADRAETRIKELEARIYVLEKPRTCSDGSCMKCHGCYEVMRAEFNDAADERDELKERNDELVSAIAYGLQHIWAGKDWTPIQLFSKTLKKTLGTVPGQGQFHNRPDGPECSYMAEVFCNKCGWVDPKLKKDPQ